MNTTLKLLAAAGLALVLPTVALAGEVDAYLEGTDLGVSFEDLGPGNSTHFDIRGNGSTTAMVRLGARDHLDIEATGDNQSNHVMAGNCPRGSWMEPVQFTGDGKVGVKIPRCVR